MTFAGAILELKIGLSPSKKKLFLFVNESPLKVMKNAFYFILKVLFVLKIFKFKFKISKKAKFNFIIYDVINWKTNNCNTLIAKYLMK